MPRLAVDGARIQWSLRRGGCLVCVAMPADDAVIPVPIFETVVGGISVIGSIVGTRQDLAEGRLVFEF